MVNEMSSPPSGRVLVVGAGATGGYYGALLTRAGRDVTFLVRPGRARQLAERGLRITGTTELVVERPQLVTADRLATPFDVVLLSVKAPLLSQAVEDVAPAVGPKTSIVPFLNGIDHVPALTRRFGRERVLGGVVKVVTALDDDGDVVQLAPGASMVVGELDGLLTERLRRVSASLSGAGYDYATSDDVEADMWDKWVFIASLGATTALVDASIGDIVAVRGGAELGPAVLAEAAAVARACGYPTAPESVTRTAAVLTRPGAPTTSSLSRDAAAGRQTEVEQVLGAMVDRGATHGVATPLLNAAAVRLRLLARP